MELEEIANKYSKTIEYLEKEGGSSIYVPERIANEFLNYDIDHISTYFDDFLSNPIEEFEYGMSNIISYIGHIKELGKIGNNILNYISRLHSIRADILTILCSISSVEENGNGRYKDLWLNRADYVKFQELLDFDFEYYYIVCQIKNELNNLYMRCRYNNIRKRAVYEEIQDLYENIKGHLYYEDLPKAICKLMPREFDYRTISKKYKRLSEK